MTTTLHAHGAPADLEVKTPSKHAREPAMLTRRGAFRQRGMDLPMIQTNIGHVDAATSAGPVQDADADLAGFIQVDDSCLGFLTPTSGGPSSSATTATPGGAGYSSGGGGGDDDIVPWPRPTDRDIHGRSDLKRTAPQWAIQVRLVLSMDFERDPSADHHRGRGDNGTATSQHRGQRRPSVVDRRASCGRDIRAGGGRRPSDFSLRSPPPGLAVHYEDIPFRLVLCSEEDSLYSN